jgi:hypothetical protein
MKTASKTTRPRARGKAASKPAPRKAKKTFDLSWLLDRPLPPESEATENYVIVMRNR